MPRRALEPKHLKDLLVSIEKGRCILFLGPHAACGPDGRSIEDEMEARVRVELEERATPEMNLAHMSLWLSEVSKKDLGDYVACLVADSRNNQTAGACHELLAQIPFSLVIQTTLDPFMENALRRRRPNVQTQIYNYRGKGELPLANAGTRDCPLVYYLRGSADLWESIPLTAEEDINHLVALVREQPELPTALTAVMRASGTEQQCTALFLGFDFAAWQTRMLLHGLLSTGRSTIIKPRPTAVATQSFGRVNGVGQRAAFFAAAAVDATGPVADADNSGPSQVDAEFLWTSYNLIFASEPPAIFADVLLRSWLARPKPPAAGAAVPPRRKISRGALRKLLGQTVPDEVWKDIIFENEDFDVEYRDSVLKHGNRSDAAAKLIQWIEARNEKSLEPLMDQLRNIVGDERFAEYEAQVLLGDPSTLAVKAA